MLATIPTTLLPVRIPDAPIVADPRPRVEFVIGRQFCEQNGEKSCNVLFVSRLSSIIFSIMGMWTCWRWAMELWGAGSATLTLILWCFSPSVLGHGHLVTGDVASMSIGIFSMFLVRKLLRSPSIKIGYAVGVSIGLSILAKPTWLILWGAMLIAHLVFLLTQWRFSPRGNTAANALPVSRASKHTGGRMLAIVIVTAICSINAAYEFSEVGKPLGSFQFFSSALSGESDRSVQSDQRWIGANRFRGTLFERLPVPLPSAFVQGIDVQKWDFEHTRLSYLRGEWRERGWHYYYLYAFSIKEPTAFLLLLVYSSLKLFRDRATPLQERLVLVVPAVVFIGFLASQTGLSKHYRYFFPVLPFFFLIAASSYGRIFECSSIRRRVGTFLVCWYALSSMWVFPHSLSYFNESVGGPHNGHYSLLGSNVAWGQDLSYLARWQFAQPERKDLVVKSGVQIVPYEVVGLHSESEDLSLGKSLPVFLALSVNEMHRDQDLRRFLGEKPIAYAGYSFHIFRNKRLEISR